MPLPEVVMGGSFHGVSGAARAPLSPVRAAEEIHGEPAGSGSRGRARVFCGLALAWIVGSATVAAELLQSGLEHRSAVARATGASPSVR